MIRFQNVGLRYAQQAEILRDVTFRLDEGGFYFLTGPSGAGKTSLLKLIYLATRASRGIINLFGEDIQTLPHSQLPALRRQIGVVFQDFRLIDHLSVFDNVALPLKVAGANPHDYASDVLELISWVGLKDKADAYPPLLSGGEQQRVAIARAIVGRPKLLIADEPTGNVDPEMGDRLMDMFEALNKVGRTTVLVATHDHDMVRRYGHQVLQIEDGEVSLLKQGPKQTTAKEPASAPLLDALDQPSEDGFHFVEDGND